MRTIIAILLFCAVAATAQTNRPLAAVNTVADLIARKPVTNERVLVAGWRTPGDWGAQRVVRHDPDSVLATNRGCVFGNAGPGRYLAEDCESGEVDARWFGATGDGTTDDTVAIQGAFDAAQSNYVLPWDSSPPTTNGMRVLLPAGQYRASGLLIRSGIHVSGSRSGTMLRLNDGATSDLLVASNAVNWTLKELILDGNNWNHQTDTNTGGGNILSVYGVTGGNIQNFRVQNVLLQNGNTNGVYLICGAALGHFEDVVVRYCKGYGFYVLFCNDSFFRGLDVHFCTAGAWLQRYSANCVVTDCKFWGNRIRANTFTSTNLIPQEIDISQDSPAVTVTGNGQRWSNIDIQENGSIGMRIGTPEYQCASSTFVNMLIDGNGGIDTGANYYTNLLYQRDGVQFVNYYNLGFHGVIDDFRARQGKGRQRRGLAFLSRTYVQYQTNHYSGLQPDDWYRIRDTSGGAIFTNIQYSLTTKLNSTNDVFQAQTYDYSTPIPQSWGTNGMLEAANDYAVVDVRIVNQLNQNEGIDSGYDIAEAGSNCKFIFNGLDLIGGNQWITGNLWLTNDAPTLTATATNGVSGFRINVLGGSGSLFRLQSNSTTVLNVTPSGAPVLNTVANLTGGNSSNFFRGTGGFAQVTTNDIPNLVTMLGGLQPLDADLTTVANLTGGNGSNFLRGDGSFAQVGTNDIPGLTTLLSSITPSGASYDLLYGTNVWRQYVVGTTNLGGFELPILEWIKTTNTVGAYYFDLAYLGDVWRTQITNVVVVGGIEMPVLEVKKL